MTLLWKPLLACSVPIDSTTSDFDWSTVPVPVIASPKLDGFRAMVQRGKLVGRNGLPVRNKELQTRYGRPSYEGLDMELCDGPLTAANVFHRTSKIVTKAEADAEATISYIIDILHGPPSFIERHRGLRNTSVFNSSRYPDFIVIKQTVCKTIEQLKKLAAEHEAAGYEGTMLRRADQGEYPQKPGKENRSTLNEFYLARLKRFEYAEAVLVAVHPLEHNMNEETTGAGRKSTKKAGKMVDHDLVGSATLRDVKTGVEFNTTIGSMRLRMWKGWPKALGVVVRYKYQAVGTKDKPRINSCGFQELGL